MKTLLLIAVVMAPIPVYAQSSGLPAFAGGRSAPTGSQVISPGLAGDNMAKPGVNCTPVGQNSASSLYCYNMSDSVIPTLPPGNNHRAASPANQTTVNIGLEHYNAGNGVALYVGTEAQAGSGTAWSVNTLMNILAGHTNGAEGIEMDVNNVSCDPSSPPCGPFYGLNITQSGTFPLTAGIILGAVGSSPLAHSGILVTSAIDGAYGDTTNATVSYSDSGTHSVGANLLGTYSGAAISFHGTSATNGLLHWSSIPSTSTPVSFSFNPVITATNGVLGAQLNFSGNNGLQIDQNGAVIVAGYLSARGNIGPQTSGFQTQGLTFGSNLTGGGAESDILLGGGPSANGSLQIYSITGSGNLSTAKGSPILALSSGGNLTVLGTVNAASIISNTSIKAAVTTVSALPACASGSEGTRYGVSDATAPTFLGTIAGGGAVHTPVYCNGTAWVAG